MNKTSTMLFLNPSSKSKKGQRNWPCFRKAGFGEVISQGAEDLVTQVAQSSCETAVSVGGDGTINLVINGIMRSATPKKLSVLYSGTSPDFCRFHHISIKPQAALEQLLNGTSHTIDICQITYANGNTCYFASSCNIGLGAEIARTSNKVRKYMGDFCGTLLAALKAFVSVKPFAATVTLDGQTKAFPRVRHIAVLKNKFIASGLYLDVPAKPDDGLLHVVVLPKLTLRGLLNIYKGKIPPGAQVFTCKEVYVHTEPTQYSLFDGDPQPAGDVYIVCLHKRLELLK